MKSLQVRFPASESRKVSLLANEADTHRLIHQWVDEDHAKLLMLCNHYGIEAGPTMFYQLALALARELYPEPKKPGAKSKWTWLNQGALVVEVERLTKPGDPTHGVTWAAKSLSDREPWKTFLKGNAEPKEVLRTTYTRFRSHKWARVARHAFAWHEIEGTIAEWDGFVVDVVRNPHPE